MTGSKDGRLEQILVSARAEQASHDKGENRSKSGLIIAGTFGAVGALMLAIATPFVVPALRKHCLPYVPATDRQLNNLSRAFKEYSNRGDSFLDIGSGDGRICELAARTGLYPEVHGVELNYMLVLYSRLSAIKSGQSKILHYHHCNLWKHDIGKYDSLCIFGVESMMPPLADYLKRLNSKPQTIFACRFPFKDLKKFDQIGDDIDTVWVYKLEAKKCGWIS